MTVAAIPVNISSFPIRHLRKRFITALNLTPLPPFPMREVGFKASLLAGERFGERCFLFPEMSIALYIKLIQITQRCYVNITSLIFD